MPLSLQAFKSGNLQVKSKVWVIPSAELGLRGYALVSSAHSPPIGGKPQYEINSREVIINESSPSKWKIQN